MTVSDAELATLAVTHDIINLGVLADEVRRRRHGNRTTFVRVATVSADLEAPMMWPPEAGEIRVVGIPRSRAAAVARVAAVAAAAHGTPVSAFSLTDLEAIAAADGAPLRSVLEELRAAGSELVADAPLDRLAHARRSIEEVNIAGLALAHLTVHQLAAPDVVPFFKSVVALQRSVGVIRAFAPLPRRTNPAASPSTGYDDVRRVALARLVVDNVASIQVDWSLDGPKLAQVALTVGADDVDSVLAEPEATQGRRRTPLEEIRRNIRAAGQEPVERNGRFDAVVR